MRVRSASEVLQGSRAVLGGASRSRQTFSMYPRRIYGEYSPVPGAGRSEVPLGVTGQEEGWQWLCEWQACEMWSLPGAAAVDVSSQEVGTGWAER